MLILGSLTSRDSQCLSETQGESYLYIIILYLVLGTPTRAESGKRQG